MNTIRMYDIIQQKRDGHELSDAQIEYFVKGCTDDTIPDYQISALLMAIFFRSLNERETATLTSCMAHSGDTVDLSSIKGIKVDKHSTGGVGDKTTMVVAPIVAACGVPVAKMSGRGLGHTGGTVDKLESIAGFNTSLPPEEFLQVAKNHGICVVGQTGNLAPADKKLYALRDVTATVDSIPLIAASIMSKKIAAGADCILLDVKVGSGAFMKTPDDAAHLAKTMVTIGENVGRHTVALITNMDIPLGNAIGNALEVTEAIDTLKGKGPEDFSEVCMALAANMLFLAEKGDMEHCEKLAENSLKSGAALEKFREMITAQGGDGSVVDCDGNFLPAKYSHSVKVPKSGYIGHINTERCGIASVALGAGRVTKDSPIDHTAGIILREKYGSPVQEGQELAVLYSSQEASFAQAEAILLEAYDIQAEKPQPQQLIYGRVSREKTEIY